MYIGLTVQARVRTLPLRSGARVNFPQMFYILYLLRCRTQSGGGDGVLVILDMISRSICLYVRINSTCIALNN